MPAKVVAALAVAALLAPPAWGRGSARIAALQTGLTVRGVYKGTVDGVLGPATKSAVMRFQRRVGLQADGIPGPRTRRALGRYGRHGIGSRPLRHGAVGWDVAALQFQLAWHGFPSGAFDGALGDRTETALIGFQDWAGLGADGVAGPATWRALSRVPAQCPIRLGWPLRGSVASPFGPRGNRFHEGVDLNAPEGAAVGASRAGRVVFAGWNDGFGNLVTIAHHQGVVTMYAHLSRIDVSVGERVSEGTRVGLVGHTGKATGPHLHFEVRLRGASVDPLPALLG
jgi:murein DD-endopeptidase MepM/ murein hydrolase activator NlpD